MPPWNRGYPPAAHVVDYLTAYEKRYELPIHRPVRIEAVHRDGDLLRLDSATASWRARHVISATGTWWSPYLPYYPGRGDYQGRQLHTVQYHTPEDFHGQRVVVVGGGNSAAQITADLASQATTIWTTPRPPRFLPDDLDGRALFELASRRLRGSATGTPTPAASAGWAISSPCPPSGTPGTEASCTHSRCSTASPPPA
ncbi:NAD(P)-binding domain-containing protein [Actinomadura luteofluorescens]|uniref:NAD(P)-binding domain-containing protein n=1 Tax=Actinomadura luteofluorescens TaxID=46163 RepID=UPI00363720BA